MCLGWRASVQRHRRLRRPPRITTDAIFSSIGSSWFSGQADGGDGIERALLLPSTGAPEVRGSARGRPGAGLRGARAAAEPASLQSISVGGRSTFGRTACWGVVPERVAGRTHAVDEMVEEICSGGHVGGARGGHRRHPHGGRHVFADVPEILIPSRYGALWRLALCYGIEDDGRKDDVVADLESVGPNAGDAATACASSAPLRNVPFVDTS